MMIVIVSKFKMLIVDLLRKSNNSSWEGKIAQAELVQISLNLKKGLF